MPTPREILGNEVYEDMKRRLTEGETQLVKAQQTYDLAVKMGVATPEANAALQDSRRRLAQMRAGLGL